MALVLGGGGVGSMRLGRVGCENGTSLPAAGSRRYSLLPLHGTTLALRQYGASVLCKDSNRIRKPVPEGHSRDVIPSAVGLCMESQILRPNAVASGGGVCSKRSSGLEIGQVSERWLSTWVSPISHSVSSSVTWGNNVTFYESVYQNNQETQPPTQKNNLYNSSTNIYRS